MTQGKLFATSKAPNSEGEQGGPEKSEHMSVSTAPPTYEEATVGAKNNSPSPSAPMHPSWAYVDPSHSPSYGSGAFSGESGPFSSFSWDDKNVRRIFIRKVYIILMIQLSFTAGVIALFTFCFACMLGFISSFYNTKSVLLCFGITALVCFAVTIFSFQTKFDFTSCHGVLFVLLIVLCISGLVLVIVLPFHYVRKLLHHSNLSLNGRQ
ncbi:hypothetical protein scyTo_0020666 [Scyliorhinus torazame]|uniref:Protein lifeguard 2 n=1 Tax=Scyliorhinus torazame TaxID=75743 RepID=A0A401PZ13_SCYTO|nr:hypothetical protein [Scyliorhinus torazame]